jgi:hypothetical protein
MFPGIDVMTTTFCDFHQFSAKLVFFLKTNVMIHFVQSPAVFCVKTPIFSPIFGRKYFKNRSLVEAHKKFFLKNFLKA